MYQAILRFFEPYRQEREIDLLRRECEQLRRAEAEYLADVVDEQRENQRLQQLTGPWGAEWGETARQRDQLARKTLRRLKRNRVLRERLAQLEARLPPRGGLNWLRYHPWEVCWALIFASTFATVRILT